MLTPALKRLHAVSQHLGSLPGNEVSHELSIGDSVPRLTIINVQLRQDFP